MKEKKSKNQIDFTEIEEKWKKFWEKEKIYKFDTNFKKKIFSIDTPPPYISGKMHIGHAFSYSQQDFIARFQRMFLASKDGNVFYPFGTDDNGLPTEKYVERLKNINSKDMSRVEFIELCLKVLKDMTPGFIQDYKDLAISSDFEINYSTIDKNSQKISQKSFIDLYKQGEIYKKEFPTLWCPECQTTIAQAELEDKEESSFFSTLKFKTDKKELLIATTRPELLGACVAVFVNPKDKRYKEFINKKVRVPLFNQEVQVLEDESAEIEKGTGVLMVCSYGDKYDVEAISKHKLNSKIVLNKNDTLNIGKYKGLKIKKAREKILNELKEQNLIANQKQINHVLNCHDKCGTPIEFIPTEQWFTKILDKKKKLIEQGKKINWYPKFMFKRYENWVNGLEWDWSISRERHFGVPIPVWECKKCKEIILPNEKELPIDPLQTKKKCLKCGEIATPEEKVLDTWTTSSLTPQITSSLVNNRIKIPFSLRPQGHDIIRTWAFYTIVKAYLHNKEVPWKDAMISGFVGFEGEKMSKSKGTGIQPDKIMKEYGADALRFWASSSKLGNDLDYNEKDLIAGKRFINKLFNASRFVFINLEDYSKKHYSVYPLKKNSETTPKKIEEIDKLFLIKLNQVIKKTTNAFEKYEYFKAKAEVEQFFWKDFCDNYLEIIKKRIYNEKGDKKISAQYTLYQSLLSILKMIAPIMPFITEEIYQEYYKKTEKDKSIHISSWPEQIQIKQSDYKIFDLMINLLSKIRQEKSKAQKPMNTEIILTINKEDKKTLKDVLGDLKNVTNAKEIKEGKFRVEFIK